MLKRHAEGGSGSLTPNSPHDLAVAGARGDRAFFFVRVYVAPVWIGGLLAGLTPRPLATP